MNIMLPTGTTQMCVRHCVVSSDRGIYMIADANVPKVSLTLPHAVNHG